MKRIAVLILAVCPSVALAADEDPAANMTVAQQLGYPADAKLLIVHSDDAGMSHSATLGTIKGMTEGMVNSASIMMPCPWSSEAAEYYRNHPDMDFGLHMTLTAEWKHFRWRSVMPYDKVPGLHDEDGFMWRDVSDVARHAPAKEVEDELRAQVKRALHYGIKPTHLDTHMGTVFARPDFFQAYRKVANEFGLPYLLPRISPKLQDRLSPAMRLVANTINKNLWKSGEITLDHLIQISGSHDDESQRKFYLDALRNLKPGITQIIIHCGLDNAELRGITNSAHRRWIDTEVFCSPEVKQLIKSEGIQMITWREIGERQKAYRAKLKTTTSSQDTTESRP